MSGKEPQLSGGPSCLQIKDQVRQDKFHGDLNRQVTQESHCKIFHLLQYPKTMKTPRT